MGMSEPLLPDVVQLGGGIWLDPLPGTRYLTDTAASAQTGVSRSTIRDRGVPGLARIDRGKDRKPRYLISEEDVERFVRLAHIERVADTAPDEVSVVTLLTELDGERARLKEHAASQTDKIAQYEQVVHQLNEVVRRQQDVIDRLNRLAARSG